MNFLNNTAVLVLGLGESGLACVQFAARFGATVTVADSRTAPSGLSQVHALANVRVVLGAFDARLVQGISQVVVSPGISPQQAEGVLLAARQQGIAVYSELDWFNAALQELNEGSNYNPVVLAVTGTNGKTTVTELTRHLCNEAGLSAIACGNISPAALSALMCALDNASDHAIALPAVWVLELSSFQLHYTQRLRLNAAALLNISQDHLDWHASMDEYVLDKLKLFSQANVCILNRDDAVCADYIKHDFQTQAQTKSQVLQTFGLNEPSCVGDVGCQYDGLMWLTQAQPEMNEEASKKRRKASDSLNELVLVQHKLMPADALRLRGTHNHANALAALLLVKAAGVPIAKALHGLRSYVGAPNRCELVRIINDVEYINDSKGTNVGATMAALSGLSGLPSSKRRLVLIAGGVGKGQDFSPLAQSIVRYCKAVVLIGDAASAIQAAIQAAQASIDSACVNTGLMMTLAHDLNDAVTQATGFSATGDAVVLSPACASFDMFKSYVHRAQVFVSAVHDLAAEQGNG
jgi:UDP-N-acetylmuramoylalanine--D-glutamate ligase